jgi:hypothetical protein
MTLSEPLLSKIVCDQLAVPELEAALVFYRDRWGHEVIWRTEHSAGLHLPDSEVELVLQCERPEPWGNRLVLLDRG